MKSIKHLDWNGYHGYIDRLAKKIDSKPIYKYIAGIDIDDMIVAVHLSHKISFPVKVITDINLFSLVGDFTDFNDDLLIVSNVVETGNTFDNIMKQTGQSHTAVLFKDKDSKFKPTYYVEVPEDRIYFPWEKCGI